MDASLKFTRVLKKKGVSQATLSVFTRIRPLTAAKRPRHTHGPPSRLRALVVDLAVTVNNDAASITLPDTYVPAPGALALIGLGGLVARRRRA